MPGGTEVLAGDVKQALQALYDLLERFEPVLKCPFCRKKLVSVCEHCGKELSVGQSGSEGSSGSRLLALKGPEIIENPGADCWGKIRQRVEEKVATQAETVAVMRALIEVPWAAVSKVPDDHCFSVPARYRKLGRTRRR